MIRVRYPLADGQQRGELVSRAGRVPGAPGPVGQVEPGGQGVGVVRAEYALGYGQQRGELVSRGAGISA